MAERTKPWPFHLNAFLHSKGMRLLDWGGALVCLVVGFVKLAGEGAASTSAWLWIGGGVVGVICALLQPVQRFSRSVVASITHKPRISARPR